MIASGRTSDLYLYGTDSVLKLLRAQAPSAWADREFMNAQLVHQAGIASPEPRGLVNVDGRSGIVFERVKAKTLWEMVLAGHVKPREATQVMVELIDRLVSVTPPVELERWDTHLNDQLKSLDRLAGGEEAIARSIIDSLSSGEVMVHGDLHPGNVLMADEPILCDWFDACRGSKLADPARTMVLISPPPGSSSTSDEVLDRPHLPGATPKLLTAIVEPFREDLGSIAESEDFHRLVGVAALCRMAENAQPPEPLAAMWAEMVNGEF